MALQPSWPGLVPATLRNGAGIGPRHQAGDDGRGQSRVDVTGPWYYITEIVFHSARCQQNSTHRHDNDLRYDPGTSRVTHIVPPPQGTRQVIFTPAPPAMMMWMSAGARVM